MVNDLQKLHRVIGSLEEQAAQVQEFNGVLRAVTAARVEIEASNAVLTSLSREQKELIKDSYEKFDGLEKGLSDLENNLADLAKGHDRLQRAISELRILAPDQFEHGRDKILLKLTELNFLTPAQYEKGRGDTNETFNRLVTELTQKIEQTNQAYQASLSTLRAVTVLGMLALAGGIAYIAYALLR